MDFDNKNKWMEFSKSAWNAAGRPNGLDPALILTSPISYDHAYYKYFERRYMDIWLSIYTRINPVNGLWILKENIDFQKTWSKNFDWNTIWKQILPFLVYGTSLGVRNEVLIDLASWYCIGQAIPSMTVDKILDNDTNKEKYDSDIAFCIISYIKTLKGIKAMELPNSSKLENVFLDLTCDMYEKMLNEHSNRYKPLPEFVSDDIRSYLLPNSRLLSSVFFGILPCWVYALRGEDPPAEILESISKLRMVRQLNDEVVDAKEDLNNGLLTLPWLYAIEEKPELRQWIKIFWNNKDDKLLMEKCFHILDQSSARYRAMTQSLYLLSESMRNSMEYFPKEKAFEITLIHNIRWALLNWREQSEFEYLDKDIYDLKPPKDIILEQIHPIEPIPGSGVVVYNSSKKVLLSLILKRGMLRWELPAGVSKANETLEETAKREAFEETGREIQIGNALATCWHYSKILNKGWMGIFFSGNIINKNIIDSDKFTIALPQTFAKNRFKIGANPELYKSIDLSDCDFDEIKNIYDNGLGPTVHESIVGSGFVDWKNIPDGRLHPLHRKLLEALETENPAIQFLYADADEDSVSYDKNSRLYFKI